MRFFNGLLGRAQHEPRRETRLGAMDDEVEARREREHEDPRACRHTLDDRVDDGRDGLLGPGIHDRHEQIEERERRGAPGEMFGAATGAAIEEARHRQM